jgi:hypothetical protein
VSSPIKFNIEIDESIYREFRKDDIFGPSPEKDAEALEKLLVLLLSQTRKNPDTIRELWAASRKVKVTKI